MPPTVTINSNQHGHTVHCEACGTVYENASTHKAAENIRRSHQYREHGVHPMTLEHPMTPPT